TGQDRARAYSSRRDGTGPVVRDPAGQPGLRRAPRGPFQSFCRDLHTESAGSLVSLTSPPYMRPIVRKNLLWRRKLDRGNATFDNIREDFNRLRIEFGLEVDLYDPPPKPLRGQLQELNDWRNAIAHQDFSRFEGSARLQLTQVRRWRIACGQL